jgi:hypothetical protein
MVAGYLPGLPQGKLTGQGEKSAMPVSNFTPLITFYLFVPKNGFHEENNLCYPSRHAGSILQQSFDSI